MQSSASFNLLQQSLDTSIHSDNALDAPDDDAMGSGSALRSKERTIARLRDETRTLHRKIKAVDQSRQLAHANLLNESRRAGSNSQTALRLTRRLRATEGQITSDRREIDELKMAINWTDGAARSAAEDALKRKTLLVAELEGSLETERLKKKQFVTKLQMAKGALAKVQGELEALQQLHATREEHASAAITQYDATKAKADALERALIELDRRSGSVHVLLVLQRAVTMRRGHVIAALQQQLLDNNVEAVHHHGGAHVDDEIRMKLQKIADERTALANERHLMQDELAELVEARASNGPALERRKAEQALHGQTAAALHAERHGRMRERDEAVKVADDLSAVVRDFEKKHADLSAKHSGAHLKLEKAVIRMKTLEESHSEVTMAHAKAVDDHAKAQALLQKLDGGTSKLLKEQEAEREHQVAQTEMRMMQEVAKIEKEWNMKVFMLESHYTEEVAELEKLRSVEKFYGEEIKLWKLRHMEVVATSKEKDDAVQRYKDKLLVMAENIENAKLAEHKEVKQLRDEQYRLKERIAGQTEKIERHVSDILRLTGTVGRLEGHEEQHADEIREMHKRIAEKSEDSSVKDHKIARLQTSLEEKYTDLQSKMDIEEREKRLARKEVLRLQAKLSELLIHGSATGGHGRGQSLADMHATSSNPENFTEQILGSLSDALDTPHAMDATIKEHKSKRF